MPNTVKCPNCGAMVDASHRFCGNCGHEMHGAEGAPTGQLNARLRLIRGDGGEGMTYPLTEEEQAAGRAEGPIRFPDDVTVSPVHASFVYRDSHLFVRDAGSRNGTYIRVYEPVRLTDGEIFLCGEQVLRFEAYRPPANEQGPDGAVFGGTPLTPWLFRVVQLLDGGQPGRAVCAYNATLTLGREDCDMNFPFDRFISREHTRLEAHEDGVYMRDLDSRNGTYTRLKAERELAEGDYIFIGRQLLRVEVG